MKIHTIRQSRAHMHATAIRKYSINAHALHDIAYETINTLRKYNTKNSPPYKIQDSIEYEESFILLRHNDIIGLQCTPNTEAHIINSTTFSYIKILKPIS